MIGTITNIQEDTITIKADITLMAKEYYHPEHFQAGSVNINLGEVFAMIEGNTLKGKGYWVKCFSAID